jgi:hypothetical protein
MRHHLLSSGGRLSASLTCSTNGAASIGHLAAVPYVLSRTEPRTFADA